MEFFLTEFPKKGHSFHRKIEIDGLLRGFLIVFKISLRLEFFEVNLFCKFDLRKNIGDKIYLKDLN